MSDGMMYIWSTVILTQKRNKISEKMSICGKNQLENLTQIIDVFGFFSRIFTILFICILIHLQIKFLTLSILNSSCRKWNSHLEAEGKSWTVIS